MNKKCPKCRLVNFPSAELCARCQSDLVETGSLDDERPKPGSGILGRALFCIVICLVAIIGFYLSLLFSAKSLAYEEKARVKSAVAVLREHGFKDEVFLLNYLTVYRRNDNWLNASIAKENA